MITILIGSEGLIGTSLKPLLTRISDHVFTYDTQPSNTTDKNLSHRIVDVTSNEFFDSFAELINKNLGKRISIIYTPAIDYPVSNKNLSKYKNTRFSQPLNTLMKGCLISTGIIYELMRIVIEEDKAFNCCFFGFDSIYASSLPRKSYYKSGVKPLAYSLSKAPLEQLFRAYADENTNENSDSRAYLIRLSAVQSKSLPEEFTDSFLFNSSAFSLVPINEIVSTIEWLILNLPISLSGSTIKLISGYED